MSDTFRRILPCSLHLVLGCLFQTDALTTRETYFAVETMPRTTPGEKTLLDDLPFHLARAGLAFRRLSDQTLRESGLANQAPGLPTLLHAAEELGDCSVGDLVERTHLANGTLTGLLDVLENEGCIRRVANPEDGRSWMIQLTKSGRKICTKLRARHAGVMKLFSNALSPKEASDLKRSLQKLTLAMRARSEKAAKRSSMGVRALKPNKPPRKLKRSA